MNRKNIIVASIVLLLGGLTSVAFAALTFTGTSVNGDSNVLIDGPNTISVGASSATGITIGKSNQTTTFPGNVSIANLAITALGSSGSPCLTVNTGGGVATTTCGSLSQGSTVINANGGSGSAPDITIGSNTPSGIFYSISEQRQVTGTALFFDAIHDENIVNVGTGGYASFDSDATINGSSSMNHTAAFQNRMIFHDTGGIGQINGFVDEPVLNAAAPTVSAFHAYDPTGTGSASLRIGFTCDAFSFASSSYCVYSNGTEPSYFGGNLQTGGNLTVASSATVTGAITSSGASITANTFFSTGGYVMSAASGFYNSNTTKDVIGVGAATGGGAIPWIHQSGNATFTGGYHAFYTDAVERLRVADNGLEVTNCTSSASPAVCGANLSGSVTVAAATTTVTVNTSVVTANSVILLTFDSSLGTKLGVTCNTTFDQPYVTARTAGTSFTITVASAPTTNPVCMSYMIVNKIGD